MDQALNREVDVSIPASKLKSGLEIPAHLSTLGQDVEIAAEAALAAGKIIEAAYDQLQTVDEKGVGDLVTKTDVQADRAAHSILTQARPDYAIISEEVSPDTKPDTNIPTWIVDPLDGTAAFVFRAGKQYPAVLVALSEKGETTIGICLFPLTGEWFYAAKDLGAFKDGKLITARDNNESYNRSWIVLNHYGDLADQTPFFSGLEQRLRSPSGVRLVTHELPHSGMAMRLLDGSVGYSAVVHDNGTHRIKQGPWDIAAVQLIMEEAGGVFVDPRGQRTSAFSAKPIIISSDPAFARWLAQGH